MYSKIYYVIYFDVIYGVSNDQLCDLYLFDGLFNVGVVIFKYIYYECFVIGGVVLVDVLFVLLIQIEFVLVVGYLFLECWELGVINVGSGIGMVIVDGIVYMLGLKDGLYVVMGSKEVVFVLQDVVNFVQFYLVLILVYVCFEIRQLFIKDVVVLDRGVLEISNECIIYQYIVLVICQFLQLLLGLIVLKLGSVWNIMLLYLYDCCSEVYFYFDLGDSDCVYYFMGELDVQCYIVIQNNEVVVLLLWLIYMGVGISNYVFIWVMGGENLDYIDMYVLDICQFK